MEQRTVEKLDEKVAVLSRQIKDKQKFTPEAFFAEFEPVFEQEGYRSTHQAGIQNILVVRLDKIGDFVLMSPFFRELRRSFPSARITLIINPGIRNLAECCPYVNEVLTLPMRDRITYSGLQAALELAREKLWARYFDLALCPRCGSGVVADAIVAYISGARQRVSFSGNVFGMQHHPVQGYDVFNRFMTKAVHINREPMQELEHNLQILQAIGLPIRDKSLELWFERGDMLRADELLRGFGDGKRLVTISLGASEPRKTYPKEQLAEALSLMQEQDVAFVLMGGKSETVAAQYIESRLPRESVLNLAGRTTLRQTEAVIARTKLYIGNDTGMLHMAAACHIPIVEISCDLPVPPELECLRLPVRFESWRTPYILLRPKAPMEPCDKKSSPIGCLAPVAHCIKQIRSEEVATAAAQLLRTAYRY